MNHHTQLEVFATLAEALSRGLDAVEGSDPHVLKAQLAAVLRGLGQAIDNLAQDVGAVEMRTSAEWQQVSSNHHERKSA